VKGEYFCCKTSTERKAVSHPFVFTCFSVNLASAEDECASAKEVLCSGGTPLPV
jgi:hypothetical protein